MEVKIGVVHNAKELVLEVEGDPAEVFDAIEKAMADGARSLWLTDAKGRRVGVPTEKLAYVEIAGGDANKRVGFGVG